MDPLVFRHQSSSREAPLNARVLILPGIMNVRFHLVWFKHMLERAYPAYTVEIRRWGIPFGSISNLLAHERNRHTAAKIAQELADHRRGHPQAPLHVVGYSGGGGLAVLTVAALAKSVRINRLLLVAAAISPHYPLAEHVLPHVSDFVVNYASRYDLQIGQGTKIFGNMDGTRGPGAGAVGFAVGDSKLVHVPWHSGMLRYLHFGDHISYLSPRWQRHFLLPALDPTISAESLRQKLNASPQAPP